MSPERKRLLVSVIVGIAATAAVVLLIGKAAHYADLLTSLRDAQPGWLVLCAAPAPAKALSRDTASPRPHQRGQRGQRRWDRRRRPRRHRPAPRRADPP